jgi:hypothetical protein
VTDINSGSTSGNVTVELYQIIKAQNVSSVTRVDSGVGEYIINITTAMPDANYVVIASSSSAQTRAQAKYSTKNFRVDTENSGGTNEASSNVNVVVFA